MSPQKDNHWQGEIEFARHLDVVGENITCGACGTALGPVRIPSDAFAAYSAGIALGKVVQDHQCPTRKDPSVDKEGA